MPVDLKPRTIVCPYRFFDQVTKRYTTRTIVPDAFCPDDHIYVKSNSGRWGAFLTVHWDNKSIWVLDFEAGFPWTKRIR